MANYTIDVEVESVPYKKGWVVKKIKTYIEETPHGTMPKQRDTIGQYAFVSLDQDQIADFVEGDIDDLEDNPVIYIGNHFAKHYYDGYRIDDIPSDILDALEEQGFTLYDNVDGGWKYWEGRPEWSDTYIDFSEAEKVEL